MYLGHGEGVPTEHDQRRRKNGHNSQKQYSVTRKSVVREDFPSGTGSGFQGSRRELEYK